MPGADRCIICGEIIPEGNQVCWSCKNQAPRKGVEDVKIIRCDICGAEEPGTEFAGGPVCISFFRERAQSPAQVNYNTRMYDLCPDCRKWLFDAIDERKAAYARKNDGDKQGAKHGKENKN